MLGWGCSLERATGGLAGGFEAARGAGQDQSVRPTLTLTLSITRKPDQVEDAKPVVAMEVEPVRTEAYPVGT